MAEQTIRERIVIDRERALWAITRTDGYTTDVRTVTAWKTTRFTDVELDAACLYDPIDVPAANPRDNVFEHRELLLVTELWTCRQLGDEFIRPCLNGMMGDVVRAFGVDPRCSGLAGYCYLGEIGSIIEKDQLGVQVHWRIPYRHLLGNPYEPLRPWVVS